MPSHLDQDTICPSFKVLPIKRAPVGRFLFKCDQTTNMFGVSSSCITNRFWIEPEIHMMGIEEGNNNCLWNPRAHISAVAFVEGLDWECGQCSWTTLSKSEEKTPFMARSEFDGACVRPNAPNVCLNFWAARVKTWLRVDCGWGCCYVYCMWTNERRNSEYICNFKHAIDDGRVNGSTHGCWKYTFFFV